MNLSAVRSVWAEVAGFVREQRWPLLGTTSALELATAEGGAAYVLAGNVILIALGSAVQTHVEKRNLLRGRITAEREAAVAMSDVLELPVDRLSLMATKPAAERRRMKGEVIGMMMSAALGLPSSDGLPSRPRCSYFTMDASRKSMSHHTSMGRPRAAKSKFAAGTVEGNAALAMVVADDHLFCPDVDLDPPAGWVPTPHREYKTFVSVPVSAGGAAYGMLTLDATVAGSIQAEDIYAMRILGRLLGIAEAMSS